MRKIATTLLAIIVSLGVFAQEKGDTAIKLKTSYGSVEECVSGIIEMLAESGIGVEYANKDLGIVAAALCNTSRSTTTIQPRFTVLEKDGAVYAYATATGDAGVSPTLAKTTSGSLVTQVTRTGQSGSILLSQWKALETIAKKIPHTQAECINPALSE